MISFVYFDLGGVVEKDFSASNKWDLMRKELGITELDKEKFSLFWEKYEKEICTSTPVDALIPFLEKDFGILIPKEYSLLQAFVNRFEKNESMWDVIYEIKQDCRIGLLTSMYPGMLSAIMQRNILPPISWDIIIDSSVVGYAKPDKIIFEIAQEKANIPPKEILFVDNSRKNILAAEELGWQTFFYDSLAYEESSKSLLDFFRKANN